MRISESRLRQILREESYRTMKEQTMGFPTASDFAQMLWSDVQQRIKSIPPGVITAVVTAVSIWLAKKAAGSATSTGTAAAVGATAAELGWGTALTNAGFGTYAAIQGGFGAGAVAGAITSALAPPVLIALASFAVGKAVEEGINAHLAGVEATDSNTRTAIKNAIIGVYNDCISAGETNKLWPKKDREIARVALFKYLQSGGLTEQERVALSLVLSTASGDIINSNFEEVANGEFIDASKVKEAAESFTSRVSEMQAEISKASSKMQADVKKV